jgi:hypothetical protein
LHGVAQNCLQLCFARDFQLARNSSCCNVGHDVR